MENKIIMACEKYDRCAHPARDWTAEELDILDYFNLDLAKSIVQELGKDNARQVAKVILGVVEE